MNVSRLSIARRTVCFDRAVCRGLHTPAAITPVPTAPAWLLGAWSYHGRVVSVLDLARLDGWGAVTAAQPVLLLIEVGRELLAIAADSALPDAAIAPPDRTDGLYDPIDHTELAEALPPVLLETARLPHACESALLKGP